MATDQRSSGTRRHTRREDAPLQPFHGLSSPGLCFASGYCVWLFRWTSTPTFLDAYESVWVVTPDGERRLYVDPVDAGPLIETYHEFDRTVGATIAWDRADEDAVAVQVEGEDGTSLELRAELVASPRTRLVTTITALTPDPVLRTAIGEATSNLVFGRVLDTNGLQIVGTTETGEPYRVEANTLRLVEDASATLDGEELGELCPPDRQIEFGDAAAPNEPFVSFGDLYLRPPAE